MSTAALQLQISDLPESHNEEKRGTSVKIAVPLSKGKLAMHFGHCEQFALVNVDLPGKKILNREDVAAPPHERGLLPPWLAERGVTMVIAWGMGERAKTLFADRGMQVILGSQAEAPEKLVADYMDGKLVEGPNACDH
jgi:predicted Fe-Mo cluster-binding NifX family protein